MAKKNNLRMPSGMGGLVRYYDEYHSRLRFKPGHIIVLAVIVIAVMILLYTYGNSFVGL